MPTVWELARRSEEHLKGMVLPGTLVRGDGLQLHRPDRRPRRQGAGEHAAQPAQAARARSSCTWSRARARATRRPRPTRSSGTARVRSIRPAARSSRRRAPARPTRRSSASGCATWRQRDPRIVGITPAMREGSGLVEFSKRFPERYFDVAIAEQHAVTFAAGLGLRRPASRGRDLLDLPAARLRSAHPRRGAAESAGGVRAGPRRPGRQRRRHPPGQLRSVLPALHSEHGDHGAGGRERMPPDAVHRPPRSIGPSAVRYPRGTGPGRRRWQRK